MRGLEDRRTLITGGASGIGRATAFCFLEEGAQVLILDRDQEAGEQLREQYPGLIGFVHADVSDSGEGVNAFKVLDNI